MDQKVLGIIPLMIAMLLVAAFAVGDNQASAAQATQTQNVNVNVPEAIALTVQDVTWSVALSDMAQSGSTTTTSPSFTVANTGNTPIDVYVKSLTGTFAGPDPIPITGVGDYQIKTYSGNVFADIPVSPAGEGQKVNIVGGKIPAKTGNSFTSQVKLVIPQGTLQGSYSNVLTYTALNN